MLRKLGAVAVVGLALAVAPRAAAAQRSCEGNNCTIQFGVGATVVRTHIASAAIVSLEPAAQGVQGTALVNTPWQLSVSTRAANGAEIPADTQANRAGATLLQIDPAGPGRTAIYTFAAR